MQKYLILVFFMLVFAVKAQTTASLQVSTFVIEAPQLKTFKKIWVYLPIGYQQSNQSYPVIYMHDAQNLFDATTSYVGEWKVDETLDERNAQTIVIGIEHGNEKRIDELTPFEHPSYKGGQGKSYLNFIVETLKPHVDVVYRTLPGRENTTIWGSSLGGLISFYAAMEYSHVFGKAGVFSPSFWYSGEIYTLVQNKNELPNVKLYLSVGENEGENMVPDQEKMVELLLEKGLPKNQLKSRVVNGKEHNEVFWGEEFLKAYQWLSKTD